MTQNSPFIQYERVSVQFNEFVTGLKDLTLSFDRGEFAFLVGPTGAGKSTVLKLLTREVTETAGTIILDGLNLGMCRAKDIPKLRRSMGIVPQDFALLPNKRVWENVGYAMRAIGKTRREVRQRIPEILDMVHMTHRADAFPGELSGGEQQRVAIARALINDPPLLVADEPTGNLDPDRSLEIMELLLELNSHGTTILVATHDMLALVKVNKRVVRFCNGELVKAREEREPVHV